MSRTLFSTSVKSPKSFPSASAASTAFWACCSKRTKNSPFLGISDRRTAASFSRHILPQKRAGLTHRSTDTLRDGLERRVRRPERAGMRVRINAKQPITVVARQDVEVHVRHFLASGFA